MTTFVVVSAPPSSAAPNLSIEVQGNDLVDQNGNRVVLRGASRSGTEYMCRQNSGIFEGPTDQNSIDVLKSWNINVVRVPLNEHCWLGIDGNYNTGENYRAAIEDWMNRLNANGIYAIADLHFTEPYGPYSSWDPQRQVMANANYSVTFWSSVGSRLGDNPGVIFELFNEPHHVDWNCLRNGCRTPDSEYGPGFQVAGMQSLLDAVRRSGARNPVVINGTDWGHEMRDFVKNLPRDPAGQLIAGQHLYNFKRCVDAPCWSADFKPVADVMPLLGVEVSQEYCNLDLVSRFMRWMDTNGGDGYLVWAFRPGSCPAQGSNPFGGLPLVYDWNGNPTPFGAVVKNHFTGATSPATTTTTRPPSTTTTTRPPSTTTSTTTTTTTRPPATTTTTTTRQSTTTTQPNPSTPNRPTETTTTVPPATFPRPNGYRVVAADGTVHGFGDAQGLGDGPAGATIVALAATPTNRGYWLAASDGTVYSYGDAEFFGDMRGRQLNQPVVGMAAAVDGQGYWLLGRDGGVFAFGSGAPFHGSTGSLRLNAPVVSMSAAPGGGYWFVAADGGVFAFGPGAGFHGSTGSLRLNRPVVGMDTAPDGNGYWLVASDGGVFAFGPSAAFHGSTGSLRLNAPVVGIAASHEGRGYRFVAADGGVFAFGDAGFVGSLGASGSTSPIVAMGS